MKGWNGMACMKTAGSWGTSRQLSRVLVGFGFEEGETNKTGDDEVVR
jgi:hypothetical protein